MKISEYLSDIEVAKIEQFNADPVLINAVKKVVLASIYENGTLRTDIPPNATKNAALGLAMVAVTGKASISNQELGEDLRGLAQAVQLLESGMNHLATITSKKPAPPENKENPGV